MKKTLVILMAMIVGLGVTAQTNKPNRLKLQLKNGDTKVYDMANVDKITFEYVKPQRTTDLPPLRFTVPTSFTGSYVQKVMYDGMKVAEICLEYIKPLGERRVVAYPIDENGDPDLTAGVSLSDGGSVKWNSAENIVTYEAGEQALTEAYIVNSYVIADQPEGEIQTATVEPELLDDVRGDEENHYAIVKIGTQFWMAENLATQRYTNGENLPLMSSADVTTWNANTTGACHKYGDNDDMATVYGLLYNGYAVTSENGLAPEGWEVPTIDQWKALKSYGGAKSANYKDEVPMSWSGWKEPGEEGAENNPNNITGFSALPGGYYGASATGDSDEYVDAWFWSSTEYYDALSRSNTLNTTRMNAVAPGFVIYDTSGHAFNFGHSVRCIRK
ncbi:MAG: fibrobacter succinogenes major paralogous domain-containing protein [Prevotella sp.]|nr:fibrobacter succinogenes major paralogous domain-containing protein [Prevotella sp.]MBQ8706295.1 fibrobacter succinogenes major paralogous domain-containing protein [Paludibacteraceae bacterium]